MKRIILLLVLFVVAVPSLAHAQYLHASFFNGGTTLSASCTSTSGSLASSDIFLGTAQGNTTVTMPTACADYDVIDLRFTQAASQTYTLTVNAGGGQTTAILSNAGTIIAAPAGAASGAANELEEIWVFNAVATTKQWELVTQETNPAATGPNYIVNPMTTLGDTLYGGISGVPTRLAGNTASYPQFFGSQGSSGAATAMALMTPNTLLVVPNAGSTGTTQNTLTILTGAPSTAVIAGTSSPAVVGITITPSGTTGNAAIQTLGMVNCIFDGATTAGHAVAHSTGTGGDCHDTGSSATTGQSVVLSTNGSGGTYSMYLTPAGVQ